jgi:hypothetical protein
LDFAGKVIALGVGGETMGGDVVAVLLEGFGEEGGAVGILAAEFCGRTEGEVEEIVEDEDLAVAVGAGADADGGDAAVGGDGGGEFAGNAFEDDGDGAGVFEGDSVGDEAVYCVRGSCPELDSRPWSGRIAG